MTAKELRQKYLDFFQSKGHVIIPSASLIPENDPTTLFSGSGMQPMVPYLLGEKHPLGTRIVDSQKCFRAQDMEEVGDNRHTTFFEMLGNWSFGDYFKKEQIGWMFEFLTKEIGLDPKKIYVSVFRGDEKLGIPQDNEAVNYWKEQFAALAIKAKDIDLAEQEGMRDGRIFYYDKKKNWWARVIDPGQMPIGEPGGPDSEMFWDFGAELKIHENSAFKNHPCHINCDCGRFLEIGNNVFMQYVKTEEGFESLPKGNIDFGGGLERILAAKKDNPDMFTTDLFMPLINKIEEISGQKYAGHEYAFRVIADHIKAAVFIVSDGVVPSNIQRGYVVRRLVRRAVRYGKQLGIENNFIIEIAKGIIEMYADFYSELEKNKARIFEELEKEENKFRKTLVDGLMKIEKYLSNPEGNFTYRKIGNERQQASTYFNTDAAQLSFDLYQTDGFPLEMSLEELRKTGISFNEEKIKKKFDELLKKHQELSRTASIGMFKGGLADAGEKTTKLHTAAHLMLAALRQVLGTEVIQRGSNITEERLRFDFSHNAKMTPEQIVEVEKIVNEQIWKKLPVVCTEMTLKEAKKQNAMGIFESKYGERVKVYSIGNKNEGPSSVEICGGPHVQNTSELGIFKIKKEESSSAGVRRIKAVLG